MCTPNLNSLGDVSERKNLSAGYGRSQLWGTLYVIVEGTGLVVTLNVLCAGFSLKGLLFVCFACLLASKLFSKLSDMCSIAYFIARVNNWRSNFEHILYTYIGCLSFSFLFLFLPYR